MSKLPAMSGELEVSIEGRVGVIALNRPQRVNALSSAMVAGIRDALAAFRHEPRVRAILFEGRGVKGFCSGGDVRAVRDALLAGDTASGLGFFENEYAMNLLIAAFPKPVVAFCRGTVMGGGIGIAGHADFRFASEDSRFAMPEAAIGFVSDVGVNAILARAPLHRALLFLMSGVQVSPGDALALGLTDCVVPIAQQEQVRERIVRAAAADDVETALVALMQAEGAQLEEPQLCLLAELCADELSLPTAREIVAALSQAALAYPQLASIVGTILSRCPSSLEAIVQSHRAARKLDDMASILAIDRRLALFMAQRQDFAEGVRAVLVDKQGPPAWSPATLTTEVATAIAEEIRGAAASPGGDSPA